MHNMDYRGGRGGILVSGQTPLPFEPLARLDSVNKPAASANQPMRPPLVDLKVMFFSISFSKSHPD